MDEVRRNAKAQELNRISGHIVDAAVTVHMQLGPGLFEQVYQQCLRLELEDRGLSVQSEVYLPVLYNGKLIDNGYRADLIIESEIIIELKAIATLAPVHRAQLLAYLKLANKKLGLLINFNVPILPQGIVRIVNNL